MNLVKYLLAIINCTFFLPVINAQLTYNEVMVQYDSAWTFKNLQLIPVKFKNIPQGHVSNSSPRTLSFTEALQKHKIKLQEMQYENGADVNWLQVTNRSKQSVMVQSGEIVAGGKQDRMVGETKIIAPNSTDYIHVYCVEKRRWDDKPKDFELHGVANSELRKVMDVSSRQNEVWKEIDRQFAVRKKTSETLSYLNLYNDSARTDTSYINYFTKKYNASDSNFAGYIFITANRIISTELFASAELTGISFINMLSSYVHSAISNGSKPVVPVNKMKEFMDKILISEKAQKAYVAGHGKIHMLNGKVIHLIAYDD